MTDEPVEVVADDQQGGYTFGPTVAATKAPAEFLKRHSRWVITAVCVITGALMGLFWHTVVTLPAYTITDDRAAIIREYGLTQFFSTDAWFSVIGLVAGLGIGMLVWYLFKGIGWPVAIIAVGAALLAAAICWGVGSLMGPSDFATRVSTANPGERVPVDFELRTWVSVVVWPFAAITPVLLASSLGRELSDATSETSGEPDQPSI